MQQQADEDELGLSAATLEALQEFAVESNLGLVGDEADLRLKVQERMDVKERYRDFTFMYGEYDEDEKVSISLTGVNPELGQTLASTGLTIWRAAQEMARFMWEHRQWFAGKSFVELGAGLGLCGVLASHLCFGGKVVITDGGPEFTGSALEALKANLEKNSCDLTTREDATNQDDRAQVALETLTWGDHNDFLERHSGGFDFIVAADVVYEEEAVAPLLRTVADLLNLRQRPQAHPYHDITPTPAIPEPENVPTGIGGEHSTGIATGAVGATDSGDGYSTTRRIAKSSTAGKSTFLLAFARRNVSIDRVLQEADNCGLRWSVPTDFEPASVSENIYVMCLDS